MALFRRKKDSIHESAHVKGHTVGTSNEVSFSVLDAAREAANGDKKPISDHGLGRIHLFSLPVRKKPIATPKKDLGLPLQSGEFAAASGESSAAADALAAASGSGDGSLAIQVESSDVLTSPRRAEKAGKAKLSDSAGRNVEISRRKSERKRGKVLAIVIGVAACAALVAVGGMAISTAVQTSNEQSGTVRGALQSVIKTDVVLMELDTVLSEPITADSIASIDRVLVEIPDAQTQLKSAQAVAQSVSQDAQVAADKDAANNTLSAISARLDMFEAGQSVLEQAEGALVAVEYVDQAWDMVLEADTAARLAADMVSKSTESAAISAACEKAESALVEFRSALTLIYDAQKLFVDADFSTAISYLEKRIEALEHFVNAIRALIDEDADVASSENEAYNTADAEAADLAKQLPSNPAQIIYDAYETAAQPSIEAYEAARTQAGISDEPLRTYLAKN